MTLVLVILVLVWVAVLLPPALRARAESRPGDSISAFRRQLSTLRRTRPGVPSTTHLRSRGQSDTVVSLQPNRGPRRPVAPGPARGPRQPGRPVGVAGRVGSPTRVRSTARSTGHRPNSRSVKRRRDIFVALSTASLATLLLGLFAPGLRFMLLVNVFADALLAAYIALLIRQRNLQAEREMKVRFLPRPQTVQPALLRRSVN